MRAEMIKHPPLLGMRRQQGRDSGEIECWETRADRLPIVKGEKHSEVLSFLANFLRSLGLPKPTHGSFPSSCFSPK